MVCFIRKYKSVAEAGASGAGGLRDDRLQGELDGEGRQGPPWGRPGIVQIQQLLHPIPEQLISHLPSNRMHEPSNEACRIWCRLTQSDN